MNDSHSSSSSGGLAGGQYYPPEHKDPYQGQQGQGQGQHLNHGHGQGQGGGYDLHGTNVGVSPSQPTNVNDGMGGMQTFSSLGDRQFERPRQPQAPQQQPSQEQQLPPPPPPPSLPHDDMTSIGYTDLPNVKSNGIKTTVPSALSIAEAAIHKSEMLQLQGRLGFVTIMFGCFDC